MPSLGVGCFGGDDFIGLNWTSQAAPGVGGEHGGVEGHGGVVGQDEGDSILSTPVSYCSSDWETSCGANCSSVGSRGSGVAISLSGSEGPNGVGGSVCTLRGRD